MPVSRMYTRPYFLSAVGPSVPLWVYLFDKIAIKCNEKNIRFEFEPYKRTEYCVSEGVNLPGEITKKPPGQKSPTAVKRRNRHICRFLIHICRLYLLAAQNVNKPS